MVTLIEFSSSTIRRIHDLTVNACKSNLEFCEDFLLNGFDYTPDKVDTDSSYASLVEEYASSLCDCGGYLYDKFYISPIMCYDLEVIGSQVWAGTLGVSDGSITLNISWGLQDTIKDVSGVLDECVPNRVLHGYRWSAPKNSGSLGDFLYQNVIREISKRNGYMLITHIFMRDNELVYKIYTPLDTLEVEVYNSKGGVLEDVVGVTDRLVNGYLTKLSTPVKEIYVIGAYADSDSKFRSWKGKYIVRSNRDGEYTLTFY